MGPKKKERDIDSSSTSFKSTVVSNGTNGRSDPAQTDHEMFLQAFESESHLLVIFFILIFSNLNFNSVPFSQVHDKSRE